MTGNPVGPRSDPKRGVSAGPRPPPLNVWLLMADREIHAPEHYDDKVFFFETSEEMPSANDVILDPAQVNGPDRTITVTY